MRVLRTTILVAMLLLASSCNSALLERLESLEQRVEELERLCREMNTNISALQTIVEALQESDYITSVTPIMRGSEVVGYTITFSKHGSITIYNGTDGKSSQIGVKADSEGTYYWTVDGEWLLDDKGNKIAVEGEDATTPQLKIEDGYWYVSYDEGGTWSKLGRATGENGAIIGVEESEVDVTFTLADGSTITLPKHIDEDTIVDICSKMDDVTFMALCYEKFDANGDGRISPTEANGVRQLSIFDRDIYSVNGIEYFTNLEDFIAKESQLRSLDLSHNLNLKVVSEQAYQECTSLESIVLPLSVTAFGGYAARRCTALTSVVLNEGLTSIGGYAFAGCSSLAEIAIPSTVATIDYNAFAASGLTKLLLPEGLKVVADHICYNCQSLVEVVIPASVTTIERRAFDECPVLTAIYCRAVVPPTLGEYALEERVAGRKIYVPSDSLEEYKKAWSAFEADIVGI